MPRYSDFCKCVKCGNVFRYHFFKPSELCGHLVLNEPLENSEQATVMYYNDTGKKFTLNVTCPKLQNGCRHDNEFTYDTTGREDGAYAIYGDE